MSFNSFLSKDEEKRLREEHITFQQEQAKVQRRRQQEIMQAMERAKKYVMTKYKDKYKELRSREVHDQSSSSILYIIISFHICLMTIAVILQK